MKFRQGYRWPNTRWKERRRRFLFSPSLAGIYEVRRQRGGHLDNSFGFLRLLPSVRGRPSRVISVAIRVETGV